MRLLKIPFVIFIYYATKVVVKKYFPASNCPFIDFTGSLIWPLHLHLGITTLASIPWWNTDELFKARPCISWATRNVFNYPSPFHPNARYFWCVFMSFLWISHSGKTVTRVAVCWPGRGMWWRETNVCVGLWWPFHSFIFHDVMWLKLGASISSG